MVWWRRAGGVDVIVTPGGFGVCILRGGLDMVTSVLVLIPYATHNVRPLSHLRETVEEGESGKRGGDWGWK